MSINDIVLDIEQSARECATESGALAYCGRHDVLYRVGDEDKERRAFAMASVRMRGRDREDVKELLDAVKNELDLAADDECPACADDRAA